jgi:hypothetical protein
MSIDEKPAICVSIVNCVQSSLEQVSTVGQAASPLVLLLKFITGVHLSQDFERIVGLCAMVFQLELMHVQLHMSALTFGTKGIPIEQYGKYCFESVFCLLILSQRTWNPNPSVLGLRALVTYTRRTPMCHPTIPSTGMTTVRLSGFTV